MAEALRKQGAGNATGEVSRAMPRRLDYMLKAVKSQDGGATQSNDVIRVTSGDMVWNVKNDWGQTNPKKQELG